VVYSYIYEESKMGSFTSLEDAPVITFAVGTSIFSKFQVCVSAFEDSFDVFVFFTRLGYLLIFFVV